MNMTIEQVAEYFINSIATRPVYPEDPNQRWYRICNEVYNLTQAGWGTDELANKFYQMSCEFPNITGHAYYVQDLIGYAQPIATQRPQQDYAHEYNQQALEGQQAYEQQQYEQAVIPDAPTYIEVPWEEHPVPLHGQDPYAGFEPTPMEQPIVYGPPAQSVGEAEPIAQEVIPQNGPPLADTQVPDPVIELPTKMEEMPNVEMTAENPWGDSVTLAFMDDFHEHKKRLGLDNETIVPHIRHFLKKEEATMSDLTAENIATFNQYLEQIQA